MLLHGNKVHYLTICAAYFYSSLGLMSGQCKGYIRRLWRRKEGEFHCPSGAHPVTGPEWPPLPLLVALGPLLGLCQNGMHFATNPEDAIL